LLGGVLWGIIGDKKGRVAVLFGTIFLYSIGNIANAFVTTIPAYAAARFFTGIGLAGEVGAGVTLLSELLPKEKRGYATMTMVCCGVLGPVAASILGDALDWRNAYIAGGVLGLLLLTLRIAVHESGMFDAAVKKKDVARGDFFMLFTKSKRLMRYVCCIGVAVPIWFVAGAMIVFTPEIGQALGTDVPLKTSHAVMTIFVGITLGSLVSSLLSQLARNRKKIIGVFILGLGLAVYLMLTMKGISATTYYALASLAGFFVGYWPVFMTTTAEQFGTNLRATASTSIANFVRGSLLLDMLLISYFKPGFGFLNSLLMTAAVGFAVAFVALWKLPETFDYDLDYIER
jgi:MFS transporter, putative metabolite:H+ symporter